MRTTITLGLAVALCLVIVSTAFFISRGDDQASGSPSVTNANLTPVPAGPTAPGPDEQRQGLPELEHTGSPAIPPPVTDEKVREYIARNPHGGGITGENVQVESIEYLALSELKPILNVSTLDDLPTHEPVVYVVLSGKFTVFGSPDTSDSTEYSRAYRVFNLRTGNELAGGTK